MASSVPANPLLIFLHLPKTAGTTLASVLEHEYGADAIVNCYDMTFVDDLASIEPDVLERARVIQGHFYFGVHSVLSRPASYITMLRDPVDRVVSHYHFVRSQPDHYLYAEANALSLVDFVISRAGDEPNNDQTRLLAGARTNTPDASTLLDIAKQHLLDHFKVVGLTEEFDRSMILMKRVLGWKTPHYVSQNVGHYSTAREMLSADVLRQINDFNALDRELYEFARLRFVAEIKRQDATFEREVLSFRLSNELHAGMHAPLATIARLRRARR